MIKHAKAHTQYTIHHCFTSVKNMEYTINHIRTLLSQYRTEVLPYNKEITLLDVKRAVISVKRISKFEFMVFANIYRPVFNF